MTVKNPITTPFEDGFIMPAEFEKQDAVWIVWAMNMETWYNGGYEARHAQVELAEAITKAGTHVNVIVPNRMFITAERVFSDMDVSIYEMTTEDCWVRDTGAIYVKNRATGEVRGVDFKFNGYGGEINGTTIRYADDDLMARKMLQISGHERYKTRFILEGGSINTKKKHYHYHRKLSA